jgi:hypothetical protein
VQPIALFTALCAADWAVLVEPHRRLLGDAGDRTIVADQRGKANGQIVGTRLEVVTKARAV